MDSEPNSAKGTNPNSANWAILKPLYDIDKISFAGGAALAFAFIILAVPTQQTSSIGILNNKLSGVFAILFIGLTTGHYLGRAISGGDSNFVSGLVGMFTVLSLSTIVISLSQAQYISLSLPFLVFALSIAHYQGWVDENQYIRLLIEGFGRGIVPAGLFIAVIVEFALPFYSIIEGTGILEWIANLSPLIQFGMLLLLTVAVYALSQFFGMVEAAYSNEAD